MVESSDFQVRSFKRGEVIFASGSRPTHAYIIQSGLVSVVLQRDETVQVNCVGPMQCLREEALVTSPPAGTSAIALRDTVVLEIPVEVFAAQMHSSHPVIKALLKGVLERLKNCGAELRSLKVARQARPCPPDLTAKVFGTLFHTARYLGTKDTQGVLIAWSALKSYAVDVLFEEPIRLEEAILILAKLGYAEVQTHLPKAENAEIPFIPPAESWTQVIFKNMGQIEAFFEFYQNYHFRGGNSTLLKTNDKITEMTKTLLGIADQFQTDRMGMVSLPYKATIDKMKEVFGKTFEAEQLFRLEQKGLMIKRVSNQDGGLLSFLKPEFEQMLLNWKILKEVELWNEHGFVDLSQAPVQSAGGGSTLPGRDDSKSEASAAALESWKPLVMTGGVPLIRTHPARPNELLCPICMSTVTPVQKYCSICDAELGPQPED